MLALLRKRRSSTRLNRRIRSVRIGQTLNTAVTCKGCIDAPCILACPEKAITRVKKTGAIVVDESKCKGCDWCIDACKYGAITLHPSSHKAIVCDTCGGDPKCIPACPESALSLTGKSNDKIVTGDIGCYTLGVLPPVNAVQTCLCMGAGISQAAGMIHAGVKEKVFCSYRRFNVFPRRHAWTAKHCLQQSQRLRNHNGQQRSCYDWSSANAGFRKNRHGNRR